MWNGLSLQMKIFASFGAVLAVFTGLAAFAVISGGKTGDSFTEYRATARQTLSLATLYDGLVQARTAALKYRISPSAESAELVGTEVDALSKDLDEISQVFSGQAEYAERLATIGPNALAYKEAFEKVVGLQDQRNVLVKTLSEVGPQTRKSLSEIMETAYRDSDPTAAFHAGRAQEQLLLGRFYAERYLLTNATDAFDRSITHMDAAAAEVNTLMGELQNTKRRELATSVQAGIAMYGKTLKEVAAVITERNTIRDGTLDRIGPAMANTLAQMTESVISRQNQIGPEAAQTISLTDSALKVGAAFAIVFGLVLAFLFGRALSRPVKDLADSISRLGDGDVDFDVPETSRRDEIGQAERALKRTLTSLQDSAAATEAIASGDLKTKITVRSEKDKLGLALDSMVRRLRDVISSSKDGVDVVNDGASKIADVAGRISQGATAQSSSVAEASAAMEQMSASIRHTGENAAETEKVANEAAVKAEQSGASVREALEAMQTIASKVTIVSEIARQTDLLALNAAVEAARAGEHGKGFAVVASEVRKLAERSQAAATEISGLATRTVEISEKSGETLDELIPSIKKTADLMQEVSTANKEQSIGADDINRSIRDLDRVVRENADAVSQANDSINALKDRSDALLNDISFFSVGRSTADNHSGRTEVELTLVDPKPEQSVRHDLQIAS